MPWLKYYICANPWIYELEHRMVQQISTQMDDIGTPEEVAGEARTIISQARQVRKTANRLNIWSFVPHYPFPPPNRRWALGLQAGGGAYPGKFTLIVHTTHASSEAKGSTEQFVLSNSCALPIYRVMLWYNNPFHFLTGWVEASVSTGMPSQPGKKHGGEHPMWLVCAKTRQASGRDSFTGSGMIDAFFDYWLPVFVHEMRRLRTLKKLAGHPDAEKMALAIADHEYQEVDSKDGISAPKKILDRKNYDAKDTLTEFQKAAAKNDANGATGEQNQAASLLIANSLMAVADTRVGQAVARALQGDDLLEDGTVLDRATSAAAAVDSRIEGITGK